MAMLNLKESCRKIIAIGRNYVDHAVELGNQVPKTDPVVFGKPATSIITAGEQIEIPTGWQELHHEVELGLVIGKPTARQQLTEQNAMDYVKGYVLALDMTGRDKQNDLKKKGLPWLLAKGFDTSCPISEFISKDQVDNVNNLQLKLLVNDNCKQNGNTKDMIFNIPFMLEYITRTIQLEPNDLILTGTPAGVSAVRNGDVIEAFLYENDKILANIKFPVVNKKQ